MEDKDTDCQIFITWLGLLLGCWPSTGFVCAILYPLQMSAINLSILSHRWELLELINVLPFIFWPGCLEELNVLSSWWPAKLGTDNTSHSLDRNGACGLWILADKFVWALLCIFDDGYSCLLIKARWKNLCDRSDIQPSFWSGEEV